MVATRLNSLFPIFAILASLLAVWQPGWFATSSNLIVPILMLIMFSMGLTLKAEDFLRILPRRSAIAIGLALQYSLMPFLAVASAYLLNLPSELIIGMVLVGCASGGTASNVIAYLAKADVALSISLTLVSTLLAIVMLPSLSYLILGQSVPVPAVSMLVSVAKIVLLPVAAGIALNQFFSRTVNTIQPALPFVSVFAIVWVIAIIVAINHDRIGQLSLSLVAAIVIHNLAGLAIAYFVSRRFGQDIKTSRTIAIEVGMQNSGLAVALAIKYFSPLAALPGAFFSIWHNVSGSILAAYWSGKQQINES